MPGRFWVKRLEHVPLVPTDDPADFDWYPLQHHFGIGAFGINAFGGDAGIVLVAEHDERAGGHEEVYVVVRGVARFKLDGESFDAPSVTVVAVPDVAVRRSAVAAGDGTVVLAIGAPAGSGFRSTWNERNFAEVPRAQRP